MLYRLKLIIIYQQPIIPACHIVNTATFSLQPAAAAAARYVKICLLPEPQILILSCHLINRVANPVKQYCQNPEMELY